MTPLQKAAKAVMDRWDSNEYNNAYLGVHITTLRKALEAEQAQAVEPANWKAHIQTARNVYSDYLDVQEALNYLEQVFLAATPALHLSEILAEKGIKLRTQFMEKPRDHVRGAGKMINEPYDQQAMELCDACGWKAIMPGEPCLLCSKDAQQVAVPAVSGALRQRLGDALTKVLTDKSAAPEPDWCDAREIDRLLDALLPAFARAVEARHGITPKGEQS